MKPFVIIENELLSKHTSWRIGGPARYYCEVDHPDPLRQALQWAHEQDVPIFLLGGGTNLLARDSGYQGLVMRYVGREWHIDEQNGQSILAVQAGAPMAGTARRISAQGWRGLEWAEGLPGTIGGAVFGNAGCYGGDIASRLQRVRLLVNDEIAVWSVEQLQYGYRTSLLKVQQRQREAPIKNGEQQTGIQTLPPIILEAELRIQRADPTELAAKMATISAERKAKTPWGRSCGSVFKNPPAVNGQPARSAGQLIDASGMKGKRIGAAEVSPIHANYIVNLGGATSDDVLRLIDLVQKSVLVNFGVELELEIQIL